MCGDVIATIVFQAARDRVQSFVGPPVKVLE